MRLSYAAKILTTLFLFCRAVFAADLMLGVDASYGPDMAKQGAHWKWNGAESKLYQGLQKHGIRWLRVRLWTNDSGANGRDYTSALVTRAIEAGLKPYLVLFLSPDWADLMKQPAPNEWKDLSLELRGDAIRQYARDTVTRFRKTASGLSHVYEIGNEIDYGICGVYPDKNDRKDPESLRQRCWPDAAKLITACQAGVRGADPEAKFILHIAHWWDAEFCKAFFEFMLNHNIEVDYAGLSFFPSANIGGSLKFEQFAGVADQLAARIHRPVLVAETAYPSTNEFEGQFAAWKNEAPGYPLTPEGQRRWLGDFIKKCRADSNIAGLFYWSPEWYIEPMWKGFALFDEKGNAKPAWEAFGKESRH